jgi:hypothetical protein
VPLDEVGEETSQPEHYGLVLAGRRRRHVVLSLDQLAELAVLGEVQEVVIGQRAVSGESHGP